MGISGSFLGLDTSAYGQLFADGMQKNATVEKLYFGSIDHNNGAADLFVCDEKHWLLKQMHDPAQEPSAAPAMAETIMVLGKPIVAGEIFCIQAYSASVAKIMQKAFRLKSENDATAEQVDTAKSLDELGTEQLTYLCQLADGSIPASVPEGYWSDSVLKAKYLMLKDLYPVPVRKLYSEAINHCAQYKMSVYNRIAHTVMAIDWRPQPFAFDIKAVQAALDATHYGMNSAKKQLVEVLAARERSRSKHTRAILLTGPQGIGKSSLIASTAEALRCPSVRLNLNGRDDSGVLTGSPRLYDNSEPGIVVASAERYGSFRYVLHVDEMDKCGNVPGGHSANGSTASLADALLDLMEGEFWDLSLGMLIDTSQILIMATANDVSKINKLLLDRMDVVELEDYYPCEKQAIVKDFIWPKLMQEYDIPSLLKSDTVQYIVDAYGAETGIRTMQKKLEAVARRLLYEHATKGTYPQKLNIAGVRSILGHAKVSSGHIAPQIGMTNVLCTNADGGNGRLLQVQVKVSPAPKNSLEMTGLLEDSLKESCRLALLLAKETAGYQSESLRVHIHFTNASIAKDGASAGLMIFCALLSALLKLPLHQSVCGTGEIDLQGNVHAVGGVRAKVLAAIHGGMRRIYVPADNVAEARACLCEKDQVDVIAVNHIRDIANEQNFCNHL